MRNNTYRIAKLSLAAVPAGDGKFSSSSAIGQFNSVLDIGHSGDTAFFLQTTARHVDFEVSDLLKASVKRLDLGVIAMRNSSAETRNILGSVSSLKTILAGRNLWMVTGLAMVSGSG